jgi:hypothetical protein
MRHVLFLVVALAGCAAPERYRAYDVPRKLTAEEREQELQRNVRPGRSWDEQERLLSEVKGAFGQSSDADTLGPKSKAAP